MILFFVQFANSKKRSVQKQNEQNIHCKTGKHTFTPFSARCIPPNENRFLKKRHSLSFFPLFAMMKKTKVKDHFYGKKIKRLL